jgi:hypothetical protein
MIGFNGHFPKSSRFKERYYPFIRSYGMPRNVNLWERFFSAIWSATITITTTTGNQVNLIKSL